MTQIRFVGVPCLASMWMTLLTSRASCGTWFRKFVVALATRRIRLPCLRTALVVSWTFFYDRVSMLSRGLIRVVVWNFGTFLVMSLLRSRPMLCLTRPWAVLRSAKVLLRLVEVLCVKAVTRREVIRTEVIPLSVTCLRLVRCLF